MIRMVVAAILAVSFAAGAAQAGPKKFNPGPGNSHSGEGKPGKSGGGRS